MVTSAGLYYPYIHFRDDRWMKAAALYWPGMARIVPRGYRTMDSPTVRTLSAELGFVQNLRPEAAAATVEQLFLGLLREHGEQLAHRLAVDPTYAREESGTPLWHGSSPKSGLGFIYAEKMTSTLRNGLLQLGLAVIGQGSHHGRLSMDPDPSHWIGVDERLAAVYMCVLAQEVSRRNTLTPVTDQALSQLAVGQWTIEDVAGTLLGTDLTSPSRTAHEPLPDQTAAVAYLALDLAVPSGLDQVPVTSIVNFRRQHEGEVRAFQEAVAGAAAELRGLDRRIEDQILAKYLTDVVSRHLEEPRQQLKNALRSHKFDTVLSTLTIQTELPALAAAGTLGMTVNPVVGAVAGAAVGIASITASARRRKAELRRANPAADYLLRVGEEFASMGAVERSLSAVRTREARRH